MATRTMEVKPRHFKAWKKFKSENHQASGFATPLANAGKEFFTKYFRDCGSRDKVVVGDPGDGFLCVNGTRLRTSLVYEKDHNLLRPHNGFATRSCNVAIYDIEFLGLET